ncbi:MAG: suppressor of fused domain protein [Planctomycetota bacterium]
MNRASYIAEHARQFFARHKSEEKTWTLGPMSRSCPGFRVLEVGPGPKSGLWNYVSLGASRLTAPNGRALEFILCTPYQTGRGVELVTMAAWYHYREGLGVGHTMPIGEPWLPGASCEYFLVSLPFPYGPELEVIPADANDARVLWLVPITRLERDYKMAHGMEALEALFDAKELDYWDPDRTSVVRGGAG